MDTRAFLTLLAGQVIGYLIGAIPFGYLITRWKTGQDIRSLGSGNIGATNVGRLLGLPFFVLVFALDFLKGAVPVLAAMYYRTNVNGDSSHFLAEVTGFAAILGHMFPIYLGMKGGKGVATTIGVLICLVPIPTVAGLAAWIVVVLIGRMVSLASIAFAITFATTYLFMTPDPWATDRMILSGIVLLLAGLVIVRHLGNIRRILNGTEPKISLSKKRAAASLKAEHSLANQTEK